VLFRTRQEISSPPFLILRQKSSRVLLLQLGTFLSAIATGAQTSQQQYVYGSVPITTTTSQIAAYAKNGLSGALSAASGSPFADQQVGSAMAVDALGRFLFVVNPNSSNISMFQINQATGALTEVSGSPFSTGSAGTLGVAPTDPVCLSAEKSGQFLYVGYRFGNLTGHGAVNEYLIDAANLQLVPLPAQPTTDIPSSPVGMLSDPKGLHLYVGLGLNASTGAQDGGTNVYSIDPLTGLLGFEGSAGNTEVGGKSIAIDPPGRFFFDSWGLTQGGIDSALISPADGTATTGISTVTLSASEIPAAMLVDSSGKFLYVQQGSASVVYSINQTTGALSASPSSLSALTFKSYSATADPLGPYIYSLQADGIHAFLIDTQTGALSEIPGSPFTGATGARGVLAITGTPVQALSGPVAALFPASENFGSISVGQSSSSRLITLTNTGDQGLSVNSITAIGVNAADFMATSTCAVPTVLSPNSTCTISIVFAPAAAGPRQASLAVADNAPGNPQSIPLTGTGVAPLPDVTLTPGSLTFASTAQGATSPAQAVTVTSAGMAALHISSVLLSGANPSDFSLMSNTCSGSFAPNVSCAISVTFSPLGPGQRTANITITDDAPNSPQSVQLTGTGQAAPPGKPAVTLSPKIVAFGTVTQGVSAGPQSVTLTNSGSGPQHISSVVLGGANSTVVSMSNTCTAPAYAAGGTCTIGVSITPIAAGLQSTTITIADDAAESPQTITISANVIPAFTIAPAAPGGTSETIKAGQTASFMLQLTPGAGFAGNVSFECAGAPTAAMCKAPSISLNSGSAVPYVVSISTTGASTGGIPWTPRLPRGFPLQIISLVALCGLLLSMVSTLKRGPRGFSQTRLIGASAVLILLAVMGIAGCGGSAAAPQSVSTPQPVVTPTPQGTFTITLMPTAMTVSGTELPPMSPIQLTLIVQ
jgi:6-phosphogluconolactonase (cycloisomerase 2 family)